MPPTKTAARPEAPAPAARSEAPAPGAPALEAAALRAGLAPRADAGPSMTPPGEEALAAGDGATAWHNDKRITAAWTNAASRNAFFAVSGLGWRRVSTKNDASFLAIVALGSHAEAEERAVNIRLGSDNEIEEIYVW